jgi:ABC-type glycerol-3-phosphate transport system substrate-binding protein
VRLTKRDENGAIVTAGAGIGTYDNVVHAPDIISLLLAQNGVDLADPSAYKDKIADALRFYTNFSQVEDNVWDATQDNTQLAFAQGNLAMYFGYSWDLDTFKKTNPSLQIKIAPAPQLIAEEKVNIASYWVEGANQKTKHPEAVLLFMKFLARADVQEKLYTEQAKTRVIGEPYSIKSLAPKLKDTDAFVFIDQSNTAVSSPFIAAASDKGIVDKFNNSLKETVNGLLSGDAEEDGTVKLLEGYSQTTAELFGPPEN